MSEGDPDGELHISTGGRHNAAVPAVFQTTKGDTHTGELLEKIH